MKQQNNYNRFLGKEDKLHIAVINYVKLQYPKVLCVHVANEAKRSKFEAWKAKAMGLTAGVPDILIFFQRPKSEGSNIIYSGLAIELKVIYANGKKNTASKAQEQILLQLSENGWKSHVTWGFDSTKKLIDEYLLIKDI